MTAPLTTPVPLVLSTDQLDRIQTLATSLPELDLRLQGLPLARLDQEDLDEVVKLRAIIVTYASTVLEFVEPQAVVQDAIAQHPAFSEDLIQVMERFVKLTNRSLDESLAHEH